MAEPEVDGHSGRTPFCRIQELKQPTENAVVKLKTTGESELRAARSLARATEMPLAFIAVTTWTGTALYNRVLVSAKEIASRTDTPQLEKVLIARWDAAFATGDYLGVSRRFLRYVDPCLSAASSAAVV